MDNGDKKYKHKRSAPKETQTHDMITKFGHSVLRLRSPLPGRNPLSQSGLEAETSTHSVF